MSQEDWQGQARLFTTSEQPGLQMTDHLDSSERTPRDTRFVTHVRWVSYIETSYRKYGITRSLKWNKRCKLLPQRFKKPKPNPYIKFPVNASVLDSLRLTGRSQRQHLSFIASMDCLSGKLEPWQIDTSGPSSRSTDHLDSPTAFNTALTEYVDLKPTRSANHDGQS